jgi:gamma-glutamylcyclotransferase
VTLWYFAYGSNMETATLRGRRGIAVVRALPARAFGWRVVFDKPGIVSVGHGFGNIVRDEAAEALGVAYELPVAEMEHLDLTEGVLIGNYRRVEIPVETLAPPATPIVAHAFVSEKRDPSLQPSVRYMGCVIAGATEHGLPAEYVEFLRGVPACEESAEARAFRPVLDDVLRQRRPR